MNFVIIVFFCSLGFVAAALKSSRSIPNFESNHYVWKNALSQHFPELKKSWASASFSTKSKVLKGILDGSADKMYVAQLFTGAKSCDSSGLYMASAQMLNFCMNGIDADGQPAGSAIFEYQGESELGFSYVYRRYEANDCIGTAISESPAKIPNGCQFTSDGIPFSLTVMNSTSAMTKFTGGVRTDSYDTSKNCEATKPVGYTFVPNGRCIATDENTSMQFQGCDADTYTIVGYSDSACNNFNMKITTVMSHCSYETPSVDDDTNPIDYNNYSSTVCM